MPPGLPGPAASQQAITAYARCFLKQAIERNVHVIALTPHSPRVEAGTSAIWRIVEEWNTGVDVIVATHNANMPTCQHANMPTSS